MEGYIKDRGYKDDGKHKPILSHLFLKNPEKNTILMTQYFIHW
jgi:hypothetical protein